MEGRLTPFRSSQIKYISPWRKKTLTFPDGAGGGTRAYDVVRGKAVVSPRQRPLGLGIAQVPLIFTCKVEGCRDGITQP